MHIPVDIVIARNNEQAIQPDAEFLAQRLKKVRGILVLLGLTGLDGVATEEDEIDAPFLLEQCFEISQPRITEHSPTPPRLLLMGASRMEV